MRTIASITMAFMLMLGLLMVPAESQDPRPQIYKVGTATRRFVPTEPYNWRGAQTHALITQIWYPASQASIEQPQWIGPPTAPLFSAGRAAPDAGIATSPAKFSLIMLSHGTGGSAAIVAWLGAALASRGYIVAAVNHPGNN